MRALKFAGLVTCGLALSVTNAAAAPQVLDDTDLDGVVAGFQVIVPGTQSQTVSDFFASRPTLGIIGSILRPVLPEVVVASESDSDSASSNTGEAVSSTAMTSGDLKADALANRGKYQALYPTPTPLPIVISFPFQLR